jgi:predicted helicase
MQSNLRQALDYIREKSKNDTQSGNAFESLTKIYLEHDAVQIQEYSRVWRYEEWAKEHKGYSTTDIGIDLVAELRDKSGYCAVQCKFYDPAHQISKADIDSC